MTADAASSRRVVVAGTGGGVGTTTTTALLFAAFGTLRAPRLVDHSGGELGRRLPGGDDVLTIDSEVTLHDLGAHARTHGVATLDDPRDLLVIVTGATTGGMAAGERVLADITARFGQPGLSRCVLVPVGVFGRRRVAVDAVTKTYGQRSVVSLPRDAALAGGGRIPLNRLSAETRTAQALLMDIVSDRVAGR